MKDSSRWFLLIALVALFVSITGSGWTFNFFGFGLGSMNWLSILLIGLVLWCWLGKGGCKTSFKCQCGCCDSVSCACEDDAED